MKVENLLPTVYYKESRDFSYIGRLLEVVVNYMKLQADLSRTSFFNENVDKNLLTLLAKTVGFETHHEYVNKDLLLIIKNFNDLVRRKGTKESILNALEILARSQALRINVDKISGGKNVLSFNQQEKELHITAPYGLVDVVLFEDLLTYILPAGWIYDIKYADGSSNDNETSVYVSSDPSKVFAQSHQLGRVYGAVGDNSDVRTDTDDADVATLEAGGARATWYTGQIYTGDTSAQSQ